jgi:uncharacterized membrane protein YdjX (TVP38/TMEM64 family)
MYRPPPWLRLALFAALLAAIAAGVVFRGQLQVGWLADVVDDYPAVMPAAFVLVHMAASLVFVPRSVMAVVAGAVFGVAWGAMWSMVGAMAGAMAGFLIARFVNDGLISPDEAPGIGKLVQRAVAGGWQFVMVSRLIPVLPHALVNYVYGLSRIPAGQYALGSFLGMLPQTLALVQFGEAGAAALGGGLWQRSLILGLLLLAVSMAIPRLIPRRWRR